MIASEFLPGISAIFLTVILIIYLIIVELGSERVKRALFPFVLVLTITFFIMAIKSVYLTYVSIK